jgi:hypothetical protein
MDRAVMYLAIRSKNGPRKNTRSRSARKNAAHKAKNRRRRNGLKK